MKINLDNQPVAAVNEVGFTILKLAYAFQVNVVGDGIARVDITCSLPYRNVTKEEVQKMLPNFPEENILEVNHDRGYFRFQTVTVVFMA